MFWIFSVFAKGKILEKGIEYFLIDNIVPRPLSAFYLFTFFVVQSKVDSEVLGKQLLCGNQVFISSLFNRWEAG